tara:strand:+ start:419 stop:808 length:390 start_codon:yes stop_codon:yes gene_type:complete
MIYIAYGANLNKSAMRHRCPDATPIGSSKVKDYKLIFNNVASIVKSPGSHVEVGLWRITKNCEKSLDRFEGFPSLYRKKYFYQGMVYIMNHDGKAVPNKNYFETIAQGYRDFNLDRSYLDKALEEAYDH